MIGYTIKEKYFKSSSSSESENEKVNGITTIQNVNEEATPLIKEKYLKSSSSSESENEEVNGTTTIQNGEARPLIKTF